MSAFDARDRAHLVEAMRLAERGRAGARPNPHVGALLAVGDEVLATGYHGRYGDRHAERVVLDQLTGDVPAEACLYVTLEPCAHEGRQPPCADLVIERGVRRVVIASADPTAKTAGKGPARLRDSGVEVVWADPQVRQAAAQQIAGFVTASTHGRPWVTYKCALTLNHRMSTGDPQRRWVTSEASRAHVQLMRAWSGAIAVGVGTVLADDPQLTVRGTAAAGMLTPPLRVVFDRTLRTPPESRVVTSARVTPTLIVTSTRHDPARASALRSWGVDVHVVEEPGDGDGFLRAALAELARRGVNDLLLEAGPQLARAFHDAGLIDTLACFQAPVLAPDDEPGFAADEPLLASLQDAEWLPVGDDRFAQVILHPLEPVPIVR